MQLYPDNVENKPFVNSAIHELEKKLSSATANLSCQQQPESSYQQQRPLPHSSVHSLPYQEGHPLLHYNQPHPQHQHLIHHHPLHHQHHHQISHPEQLYQHQPQPHHQEEQFYKADVTSTSNEGSSLHAILQVIRAEQQQEQQHQAEQPDSKHCDHLFHTEPAGPSPPIEVLATAPPAPKFSAVNFRRVHRHPPVSFPKRPLVTQRSLGSPPSVNLGSSYSPSGSAGSTAGNGGIFGLPIAGHAAGQQVVRRRSRGASARRHEAFVKTRSKTISDFFGPESTPVSRLLNIICQEKEAERVAANTMNSQQQQQQQPPPPPSASRTGAASSKPSTSGGPATSSSQSGSSRVLRSAVAGNSGSAGARSRKENIVPVGASGSDSGSSGSAGAAPVPVDPAYAAKDIDRIAKYKADRRKAIYLRNNVHENENERLEPSKRSSSRTPNTLPSSAILSNSSLPAPPSKHAATASTSNIRRPHSTGTVPGATKVPPVRPVASGTRLATASAGSRERSSSSSTHNRAGDERTNGAGATTISISPSSQAVAINQSKQIRTTRSSRLRAAAAHAPSSKPSFSGSTTLMSTSGEDQPKPQPLERSQRSQFHRTPAVTTGTSSSLTVGASRTAASRHSPSTTTGKHSNGSTVTPSVIASTRTSKLLAQPLSKREQTVKKVPSSVGSVDSTAGSKRLVPSIAVNMKQRLKTMTETIKGDRAGGKPATATTNSVAPKRNVLAKGRAVAPVPIEPPSPTKSGMAEKTSTVPDLPKAEAIISNGYGGDFLGHPGVAKKIAHPGSTNVEEMPVISSESATGGGGGTPRFRTSTMKRSHSSRPEAVALPKDINGLSPVKGNVDTLAKQRQSVEQEQDPPKDKSAKRKSFLNRSQTDESASGARSTSRTSSSSDRFQRRLKMPHGSPDMHSSSNRSSPLKSASASSSATEKSPTVSPRPSVYSSARSSPKHPTGPSPPTIVSGGSSPVRICSRMSSVGGSGANSPNVGIYSRSPPLAYHMEQARRELAVVSPPRTHRLLKIVNEASASPAGQPTKPLLNDRLDSEQQLAAPEAATASQEENQGDKPSVIASSAAVEEGPLDDVRSLDDGEEVANAEASAAVVEEIDEISEEQSSSIGQYSKFSQILKSPTLEVTTISDMMGNLAIVDSREDEEAHEEEEEMHVPSVPEQSSPPHVMETMDQNGDDDHHGHHDEEEEEMKAGPSGLCMAKGIHGESVQYSSGHDVDYDEDDDGEEDEQERLGQPFVSESRGYIAVVDVGEDDPNEEMRPANRILFDDQFNDEFVVIENSPKSQLIHSLDEEDIIVLRDGEDADPDLEYAERPPSRPSSGGYLEKKKKKLVKMSSVECFERKSLSPQRKQGGSSSPIFRAKSMDESSAVLGSSASSGATAGTSNHIVSILKRKTVESTAASSASSNASPVTFSPSVVDTPIRSNRKQGILKKRCSLDESRYSRSHSPDDRSILVRHTRRNSFEDGASSSSTSVQQQAHGILKQKSYESREDVSGGMATGGTSRNSTASGCSSGGGGGGGVGSSAGSNVSHGILKKKNDSSSTSTPSEQPKHVSISQAVILAAAEICHDMLLVDEDGDGGGSGAYDIKPILKTDHQAPMTPKPILKKKYSSENEEIRPILKSSRKSSREENSDSEEMKRSILKIDSPAKRRCFVEQPGVGGDIMLGSAGSSDVSPPSAALSLHSRSLDHPDPVGVAPIVPQVTNIEKPIISVAERIRNMEKFLSGSGGPSAACSSAGGTPPTKQQSPSTSALSRRESFRYKNQPVNSTEINSVQQQQEQEQQGIKHQSSSSCEEGGDECSQVVSSGTVPGSSDVGAKDLLPDCTGTERVLKTVTIDPGVEQRPEPVDEPAERRIAPEHSCLRSSLELLIQRSHSADPKPLTSQASGGDDPTKPTSSSFELLSPTLGTAESASHSIISGEFNLASLSSDSGVQFLVRGGTEDYGLSSSVKTSDSEKSPSKKTIDDNDEELNVLLLGEEEEDDDDRGQASRHVDADQLLVVRVAEKSAADGKNGGGDQSEDESTTGRPRNGAASRRKGRLLPLSPTSSSPSSSPDSGSSSDLSDRESAAGSGFGARSATSGAGADDDDDDDASSTMFGGCVGFGRNSGGGGGASSGGEDGTDKGLLRRSSSVRAKASMFAQLESKLKENENPLSRPIVPRPRRAQFATQTISPTDIERSNNAINSGLNCAPLRTTTATAASNNAGNPASNNSIMNTIPTNNNNVVSDDSGAEFDPSTLQVSKKVKLFSGGCITVKGEDGEVTVIVPNGNNSRRKKSLIKLRTVGKLVIPKFLNDSNNNISAQQQHQDFQRKENGSVNGTGSEGETDIHILPKVERIRRKFMSVQSTPKIFKSSVEHGGTESPSREGAGTDADDPVSDGSESDVDSGKENNYDSGVENMNGSTRGPTSRPGSSTVLALKRNFLNSSNRTRSVHPEKDPVLEVSAELDGIVTKGKVSSMASQWNRLRSMMTLDVSSILKASGSTFETPPSPASRVGNGLLAEPRMRKSSPVGRRHFEPNASSPSSRRHWIDPNYSCKSNGGNSSKFALVDARFAKYFGCAAKQNDQGGSSPVTTGGKSMIVTRNASIKESSSATAGRIAVQPPRRRTQSMPKESHLLEQRLESIITSMAAGGVAGCVGTPRSQNRSSIKLVNTVEELNITTEDLSTADIEFDKLYIGVCLFPLLAEVELVLFLRTELAR
ncbi:AGAP007186-PA-like protein [Anopheles sinensis]|uniref:AGAP007186-PA-like protein n=1 Tax=Anopheles sinensis TaxID=74873 RepID=A0A084VDG1_ANOSI|nr:AGAP007186-PA-like protein [Anopheles sinensis]